MRKVRCVKFTKEPIQLQDCQTDENEGPKYVQHDECMGNDSDGKCKPATQTVSPGDVENVGPEPQVTCPDEHVDRYPKRDRARP